MRHVQMGRSLPRTTRDRILLFAWCNSASVMPPFCTAFSTSTVFAMLPAVFSGAQLSETYTAPEPSFST